MSYKGDLISRRAAIEAIEKAKMAQTPDGEIYVAKYNAEMNIQLLPSVQPEPSEITDERAILHLQSTGWMQNHNREIYESVLKERLADDSKSYDSLIPHEDDGDTISRQMAIDAIDEWFKKVVSARNMSAYEYDSAYAQGEIDAYVTAIDTVKTLTSVQPEPKWIPCSERMPEPRVDVWCYSDMGEMVGYYEEHIDAWYGRDYLELIVTAWMPLPIPYCGGNEE